MNGRERKAANYKKANFEEEDVAKDNKPYLCPLDIALPIGLNKRPMYCAVFIYIEEIEL